MGIDGWSLNEEIKDLKKKLQRHENILGALAVKVYKLEDESKVSEASPPKTKKKAKVTKDVKSK